MSNELDVLAKKYNTDKQEGLHGYTSTYFDLFNPIKDTVREVLELGVWFGASHKMWKDFFPYATVYGVDNFFGPYNKFSQDNPDKSKEEIVQMVNDLIRDLGDYGIKLVLGNQEDQNLLSKAFDGLEFDIIVDDGGHAAWQQQKSFKFLWDFVKPGGYYIIEDLGVSEQREFRQYDDIRSSTTSWLNSMIDGNPFSYYISTETLEDMLDEVEYIKIIGELAIIKKKE